MKIESIKSKIVSTRLIPFGSHRSFITEKGDYYLSNKYCSFMLNWKKEDPFEDDDLSGNSTS